MDGVKIIADAIRKERAEKEKTSQPATPANVADITAQFTKTGKVEHKEDTEQKAETTEQKTETTEQKAESEVK